MSFLLNPYIYATGGSGFDPTTISGCTLWLAADEMSGFADGDAVGGGSPDNWNNLGSAGGDFAEPQATRRPTYQENEINGTLPVVRFSNVTAGQEDELLSSANISTIMSVSAYAFFFVVRPTITGGTDGTARYYRRPRIFSTPSSDIFAIGIYNSFFYLNHNSVTGPKILSGTAFTPNQWAICEAYYDGATMSIRCNGGAEGTIAGANVPSLGTLKAVLGRGTDLAFDGDLAEAVGFNVYPGATDMTAVRNGLAAKHGITV